MSKEAKPRAPGPASGKPSGAIAAEPRRGFLAKALAVGLGVVAYAGPVVAGLAALLNPLRQKGGGEQWVGLTTVDALPEDGAPSRFPVVMDRTDAWNRFPREPVGAVYLRRLGESQVAALHVVCPHAGCFIDYDATKGHFYCPCHLANFDLDGRRAPGAFDSPRDMDTLDVEIRDGGAVWVRFQNFQSNTPKKVPLA
jgi:Rieske Fe-S protein